MKRERDPTPEEFEKLLAWLDPDENKAGLLYTQIQNRLTKVFAARGCIDPETLGEEVLNRVCVRIDTVKKNYSDPLRCCLGFVDNVFKEYWREQKRIRDAEPPPPPPTPDELEKEASCLEQCLGLLDETDRDIIKRYFDGEKRVRINNRKQLAAELGKTANALRIQAFKLRKELNQCLQNCFRVN